MGRFIGLDLSTKTGVVILDESGNLLHKEEIVKEGADPKRMLDMINAVMDVVVKDYTKQDVITIEDFAHGGKDKDKILGGIGWGVRMDLYDASIKYNLVSPTILKKFATGKGNSAKNIVMKDVYKRWKFEDDSDNIVDAYVLAQIGRALHGEGQFTKEQIKTLEKVVRG